MPGVCEQGRRVMSTAGCRMEVSKDEGGAMGGEEEPQGKKLPHPCAPRCPGPQSCCSEYRTHFQLSLLARPSAHESPGTSDSQGTMIRYESEHPREPGRNCTTFHDMDPEYISFLQGF